MKGLGRFVKTYTGESICACYDRSREVIFFRKATYGLEARKSWNRMNSYESSSG